MSKSTMTPEDRLVATIKLEPTDRVVCAPQTGQYAGQFAGISNKEFVWEWDKSMAAMKKLALAYPMWDCSADFTNNVNAPIAQRCAMGKMKFPGRELKDNEQNQIVEYEVMTREDYDIVKEKGYGEYFLTFLERSHQCSREEVLQGLAENGWRRQEEINAIRQVGQTPLWGGLGGLVPFDAFSLCRSIDKYYKDMFQLGNLLEELFPMLVDSFVETAKQTVSAYGINRLFVGGSRSAGQFLSKKNFERYAWPYFKDLIEKLVALDIVPILHFDCDWTNNLEYFLELPKAKFVLELDGATDIFKAKEVLGSHCAIKGDVPASYFTVASPSEMDEYCKKLITKIGKNGGFILAPGCCMPMNAKHENVKAFFEAVEKYGYY